MIICVTLLFAVTTAASYGASTPVSKGTIKSTDGVIVRASASVSSKQVGEAEYKDTIQITKVKFTSAKSAAAKYVWVYSSGHKGYIRSDLVTVSDKTSITGTTTDSLNMRKGAGTGFAVLKTLNKKAKVTVTVKAFDKDGKAWYKVKNGTGYGYVSADYVTLAAAAKTTTTTQTKKTTTSTASKTAVKPAAISKTQTKVSVLEDGTIIRKSASVKSAEITKVKKATVLNITEKKYLTKSSEKTSDIWYYTPTYKGWIRADLVESYDYYKLAAYTTDSVNMRRGAGTGFKVKATLPKSTAVEVSLNATDSAGGKWVRVTWGKKNGYVSAAYVTIGKAPLKKAETETAAKTTTSAGKDVIESNGFPSTYNVILKKLAKKHPNWIFKPVDTGLEWTKATKKMVSNPGANTIYTTYAYAYRSVEKGCYNYLKHTYSPKDGSKFVAAAPQAVYYYMDPRNWLDAEHIFMFEDQSYHPEYQTKAMVKSIFGNPSFYRNKTLYKNAGSFITAAKESNLNAVYLASKALNEQGSGINSGKVGGKKVYNIFNIGAYDSASGGAANGLKFAASGSSYMRPWTSIDKAIRGGAKYISSNFSTNKQNSCYLEHFNVLNGLNAVGTHVYMTAVYAPMSTGYATAMDYQDYGIYNNKIVFYIPVYHNMPKTKLPKPSISWDVDNNYYLKNLSVKAGGKTYTAISSGSLNYKKTFSITVPAGTTTATINASKASVTAATVKGTGKVNLSVGTNKFKVKCKSSSGLTRTYTLKIIRKS